MIYTLTLNPALDYVLDVKDFKKGVINRSFRETVLPGGKGINVSQILKERGKENTAVFFSAGFTGKELERMLSEKQISVLPVPVRQGMTRINVKLRSGEETAINARGPMPDKEETEALLSFTRRLQEEDIVVLSGNIPSSLPNDIYRKIGEAARAKKARIVVDTEGEAFKKALALNPLFVKPNHEELEAVTGVKISSVADALKGAAILKQRGAENVLVSMGEKGALLLAETGAYYGENPKGRAVNTVGAGDSMVAAFLAELIDGSGPEKALTFGIAAGSATAFSDGLATSHEIEELSKEVKIKKLEGGIK